jgi:RNA polymerase sigma factor (sigma-70 family)
LCGAALVVGWETDKLGFYLRHRAALVDYALPIVGSRDQAEDVVQEAWLRFDAATAERPAARIEHPAGYLYRIVRNLALDWTRKLKAEPWSAHAAPPQGIDPGTPERTALFRDELRVVAAAMAELPPRTRRAFALYRLGGRTMQQVADELGISVGLAHRLIRDAITHCAQRLGMPQP